MFSIYTITNTKNGFVYVGRTTNTRSRWGYHRSALKSGVHHNPYLQKDWAAQVARDFSFEVVQTGLMTTEDASAAERDHVKKHRNVYNLNLRDHAVHGARLGMRDAIKSGEVAISVLLLDCLTEAVAARVLLPSYEAMLRRVIASVQLNEFRKASFDSLQEAA